MKEIHEVSTLDFLMKTRQIYKNPLPFHHDNFRKFGNTFKITPKPGLTIHFSCDENVIKHILQKNQKNFNKSTLQTEDLGKYIGHGLLTENGEKWRANRKLIQPAFYKKSLVNLLATMKKTIEQEIDRIPLDKDVDIYPIFNDLAFKVVARSLFDLPDMEEDIKRLQYITEQAQQMLIKELRIPWMKWYFDREWLAGENSVPFHQKLVDESREILRKIIVNRRKSEEQHEDLLHMLLHSTYEDGTYMEEEQLIDEILVLFIAGHETTSNALSFAVQLLAHHPEIQAEARIEIQNDSSETLFESLAARTFVKQCVEETLRLYPPAYVTDRVTLEDDHCGDIAMEKGSIWLISFYELHRRKDLWEDAEVFKPHRFDPAVFENKDYYFPFGAGPRMCVGNNFAIYEMVLAVSAILEKFYIAPVQEEIEIHPLITLKPKNAVLRFSKAD
jgi:cytochrome P450